MAHISAGDYPATSRELQPENRGRRENQGGCRIFCGLEYGTLLFVREKNTILTSQ